MKAPTITEMAIHAHTLTGPVWRSDAWSAPDHHLHIERPTMPTTGPDFLARYLEFVTNKSCVDDLHGYPCDDTEIHPQLFAHQRAIVRWAVGGGRRGIFAAFGLGKSKMQVETVRLTLAKSGGDYGLIVCPLGVRQEFMRDALELGVELRFVRRAEEMTGPGIYLTNYESIRDGRLDVDLFTVISLDEASVLRSYGSKTFWAFVEKCANVAHRFVATATPSPNRHKELLHYAHFLGVMDTGQALTRFFKRDSEKAGNLTLNPHKEDEFWLWLASWSVFLQMPSDLGFPDDGYVLPDIEVRKHVVAVDLMDNLNADRDGQGLMFRTGALGVVGASREKRSTLPLRVAKMADIVHADSDDHFILWHHLELERAAIRQAIPEAVEVFGSLDLDEREKRIIDFSDGKHRLLATKPSISGSGCNFQRHCHRAIFVGIDFDFNDFIQAVHRIQRFGQARTVVIDIIIGDTEHEVFDKLMHKWAQHKELVHNMSEIIRSHGLSPEALEAALVRSIGVERVEAAGVGWCHVNNDTVPETASMDTDSVDMIVTSIPFANHYEYTPSYNDFGHTDDNGHFWAQMDFLTPNLLRVLKPGRVYACHVKDRIIFNKTTGIGSATVSPFHAEAIMHATKHGFSFVGMITIATDVVRENNQSYRLGYTEMLKDSTTKGVGSPEYVLLFRKPPTGRDDLRADEPVVKEKDDYSLARWQIDAHAFWRSSGDRLLTADDLTGMDSTEIYRWFRERTGEAIYDLQAHIRIGEELEARGSLPKLFMLLNPASTDPDVWVDGHDITRMRTLNSSQAQRGQDLHVCPLQFDIVDRLIERFTNKDELVYDPFGGLATVPFRAMHLGRRGRSVELNGGYWADGVRYCQAAEAKLTMPTLFDMAVLDGVINPTPEVAT